MKNEKLCLLIKQGDTGYLPELWEQTRKFITMQAKRFYRKGETHNGVEIEDLVQCGYFAILQAVERYEPERGFTFLTFLNKTLTNAFCEAIGIRSSKRDILNCACSLDEPHDGDESKTLLKLIGDLTPGSGDVEATVIESVYHQELHQALDNALTILQDKKRSILELHYYFGMSFEQLAADRSVSRALIENQAYEACLKIYNSSHREKLKPFLYFDSEDSFLGTGYRAWKHSGMSVEERETIRGGKM